MHGKAMQLTIPLRLPADMVVKIDAIVARRPEQPSRNLVIRELIAKGLQELRGSADLEKVKAPASPQSAKAGRDIPSSIFRWIVS